MCFSSSITADIRTRIQRRDRETARYERLRPDGDTVREDRLDTCA